MPRPTAFSEGCMTSQRRQEPVSTPDVTVASAWPRSHYPLPPKQHKQRRDGGQHVLHAGQLEAGTGRQRGGLLRSSRSARPLVASKPYWPEKTERIDESYQLHMSVPDLRRTVSPARLRCPASEHLLRWRPLLPTHASPSSEDLDKRYQLTALAWEPSTLMSYTSRLLVFHTWADSKSLPEEQRAPVSHDTLASFTTDLAGAYVGDTIANYIQGAPFEAMKGIGRWSSDSFSRYLRKHVQILAPYVQTNPDLHQQISQEQMSVVR
jgi:hypothetical protein